MACLIEKTHYSQFSNYGKHRSLNIVCSEASCYLFAPELRFHGRDMGLRIPTSMVVYIPLDVVDIFCLRWVALGNRPCPRRRADKKALVLSPKFILMLGT